MPWKIFSTRSIGGSKIMSTIALEKQTEEIDTPEGIMNFLQKRNGQFTKNYKSRYSVTELGWMSEKIGIQTTRNTSRRTSCRYNS